MPKQGPLPFESIEPIRDLSAGPAKIDGVPVKVAAQTVTPQEAQQVEVPVLPTQVLAETQEPAVGEAAQPSSAVQETSPQNCRSFWRRLFFGVRKKSNAGNPPGFGAPDGLETANKDAILGEIDQALGATKPPSLEVIWVRPFPMLKIFNWGFGTNPFGHVAVRYTLPDGVQKTMNIVGVKGHEMVNFLKPEDYFYGTRGFVLPSQKGMPGYQQHAEEQGGVYNRGMISLRIETLPDEIMAKLDAYYENLKNLAEEDKARFSLEAAEAINVIHRMLGSSVRDGNCALWVSSGLKAAGLLRAPSFWPKKIWVDLYKKCKKLDPSNVHIVSYRHISQAVQTFSPDVDMNGLVSPWNWIKNVKYWNLEKIADVIVEVVPVGSTTAQVRRVRAGKNAALSQDQKR